MIFEFIDPRGAKYKFEFNSLKNKVTISGVYFSPDFNFTISNATRLIVNKKVVWFEYDDFLISVEAQRHCNRLFKNKAFM
jgi:hypothetical protein